MLLLHSTHQQSQVHWLPIVILVILLGVLCFLLVLHYQDGVKSNQKTEVVATTTKTPKTPNVAVDTQTSTSDVFDTVVKPVLIASGAALLFVAFALLVAEYSKRNGKPGKTTGKKRIVNLLNVSGDRNNCSICALMQGINKIKGLSFAKELSPEKMQEIRVDITGLVDKEIEEIEGNKDISTEDKLGYVAARMPDKEELQKGESLSAGNIVRYLNHLKQTDKALENVGIAVYRRFGAHLRREYSDADKVTEKWINVYLNNNHFQLIVDNNDLGDQISNVELRQHNE